MVLKTSHRIIQTRYGFEGGYDHRLVLDWVHRTSRIHNATPFFEHPHSTLKYPDLQTMNVISISATAV